ncbi:hypothetical protein F4780DRAFT_343023 [Xylariomycetidae sp. FL0641]|nr:hypothetical protein F4780DRAFT_343023 [Xylariomycetidae sp. FL0641]
MDNSPSRFIDLTEKSWLGQMLDASANARRDGRTRQERERPYRANYVVFDDKNYLNPASIIDDVQKDLGNSRKDCTVKQENTPAGPILAITAPTEAALRSMLEAAREKTEELLAELPSIQEAIFVEPPTGLGPAFAISLIEEPAERGARHCFHQNPSIPTNPGLDALHGAHTRDIAVTLHSTLMQKGRLHSALTIRISFGHYLLRSYPRRGWMTFNQFLGLVKDPRATGFLQDRLGGPGRTEVALEVIKNNPSTFYPVDSQTPSVADVEPTYMFETSTEDVRFEAIIDKFHASDINTVSSGRVPSAQATYKVLRPRVFLQHAGIPELDIVNVCPGRKLDWKVAAIKEERDDRKYHAVYEYFNSATVDMQQGARGRGPYPRVRLMQNHALAGRFKEVAVKAVYRFGWKTTSYIVEVSINRRWSTIAGMVNGEAPTVDFTLGMCGDSWDEDMLVAENMTTGELWGPALQYLFRDGPEGGGLDRVRRFLQTVQEVRGAFEPMRE